MSAPDPQLQASNPRASAFVTANAGSGKTTTLVRRVARLLLQGARPEAILCVTYTKAAAAEMQSRLFEELGGWAVMNDAELRAELAAIEEGGRQPARARRLFALALETPGGLKIQTIHAFCEKLLRRFPLEAGVSPGFRVAEDAVAAEIAAESRDAVALRTVADPDGRVAAAYRRFAVTLDPRALAEMFAAFESRRSAIAKYVEGVGGAEAVAADVWTRCTGSAEPFDVEAQAEAAVRPPALSLTLWRRVVDALRGGGKQDCDCAEALQRVLDRLGAKEPAWEAALEALFTGGGTPRTLFAKSKALKAADLCEPMMAEVERIDAVRERVRAARMAADTVHALALAAAYGVAYAQVKTARSALDFADLIERAHALLAEREDAAWVLYKLDGGIDHVLVDEAQDTAPEQWDIVRSLTDEFFSGAGLRDPAAPPRTVFAVGDEKQSIYSFQGARPERMLTELQGYARRAADAGLDFVGPTLAESWRSTDQVLSFVDAVFAEPEMRAAVPAPAGLDILKHQPRRRQPGCVDLWAPFQNAKREEPDVWDPLDAPAPDNARKRLARRIAAEIKALCERGERVWDKRLKAWRAARPGDVLILVRRRDALFEEISRALKKAGLPVSGADRLKLSEHAAFQDLVALARFALYPRDDLTTAELLRSPFCDVDEDALYALARDRKGSLWKTLRDRAGERPEWADAAALFGWARSTFRRVAPYEFFAGALARRDRHGASMRRRMLARLGAEADDAVDAFLNEVLALEGRGPAALETVVSALERAEVEVKRELDEGSGEVRVMTVHGAKGLEAPIVVLPDTTQKPPGSRGRLFETQDGGFLWCGAKAEDCEAAGEARAWSDRRAEEEYLRLYYVALTRARDRIIVCGRQRADRQTPDKGSWWMIAEAAFARPEIAEASRPIEADDLRVRRYGPDPEAEPSAAAANDDLASPPAWTTQEAAPEPLSRWTAPSALTERRRGTAPSPLASTGGLGRFRRGSLIHRLLQLLPDVAPDARAVAAERLLAREPGLTPEQVAEITGSAMTVIEHPRFAEVFSPGSRAEAAVAGSAPELPEGLAISGRVDRLVVTPDRVLVVDYKTNRPSPDRAEKADRADLVQMATYVAVLRRVFPGRTVEAALVWTDGARLTPLSDSLVAATLAGLSRVDPPAPDSYIADLD